MLLKFQIANIDKKYIIKSMYVYIKRENESILGANKPFKSMN